MRTRDIEKEKVKIWRKHRDNTTIEKIRKSVKLNKNTVSRAINDGKASIITEQKLDAWVERQVNGNSSKK